MNASDDIQFIASGTSLYLEIEIRNDTWRVEADTYGELSMTHSRKIAVLNGLQSNHAECTGFNALLISEQSALISNMQVLIGQDGSA